MGWDADDFLAGQGVWALTDGGGYAAGVVAIWMGPKEGNPWRRDINEWRVVAAPLPDDVNAHKTTEYGSLDGNSVAERRASFQRIWDSYKAANRITSGDQFTPLEWIGRFRRSGSFEV